MFISTALSTVQVEPVGRWFEAFAHRRHHNYTLSHHSLGSVGDEDDDEDLSEDEEEDEELLRRLDPKDWKVTPRTELQIVMMPRTEL